MCQFADVFDEVLRIANQLNQTGIGNRRNFAILVQTPGVDAQPKDFGHARSRQPVTFANGFNLFGGKGCYIFRGTGRLPAVG